MPRPFSRLQESEVPEKLKQFLNFEKQEAIFSPNHRQKQGYIWTRCPDCGTERWFPIGNIRSRLRRSCNLTLTCEPCAHLRTRKYFAPNEYPERMVNFIEPNSQHYVKGFATVNVICPDCGRKTRRRVTDIKGKRVTAYCKEHSTFQRSLSAVKARGGNGKTIDETGYVSLCFNLLDTTDRDLAKHMRNHNGRVLEHRLVMAKHLNRPLTKNEIVHHKDGDKGNNDLDNLQLFINGHHSGHGSFYQVWQESLSEINRLKSILDQYSIPYS